jgi:hypothetical protein
LLRIVSENHESIFAERELGVRMSLVVRKLDLKYAGGKSFDDGADVAPHQALVRQIDHEGDDIEQFDARGHAVFSCERRRAFPAALRHGPLKWPNQRRRL